jgi:hypothetical protein
VQLADSSANVLNSYLYKAFGESFSSSGTTLNMYRYVGELGYYYDLDRLAYYLRARPYSPKLASPDYSSGANPKGLLRG